MGLHTAFRGGGLQAVAFTHGDAALNQNFIGIVDDVVHDCLGNGAAGIGIGGTMQVYQPSDWYWVQKIIERWQRASTISSKS